MAGLTFYEEFGELVEGKCVWGREGELWLVCKIKKKNFKIKNFILMKVSGESNNYSRILRFLFSRDWPSASDITGSHCDIS